MQAASGQWLIMERRRSDYHVVRATPAFRSQTDALPFAGFPPDPHMDLSEYARLIEDATVYDVALMRETVGPDMGVKASGGLRTASDVEDMIAAGATRIGASAGVQIVGADKGDDDVDGY